MSHRTVTIKIPADASPGDVLSFVVDGTVMELYVPEGSQPGEVLQVQLSSTLEQESSNTGGDRDRGKGNQDDDEDDGSGPTTIALWNDMCLHFVSKLPDKDTATSSKSTSPPTQSDNDGTHSHVWSSARHCVETVLASANVVAQLHSSAAPLPRRVLELGSGTGVLGLAYATLPTSNSTKLVLTDCPAALPLLQYNVDQNKDKLPATVDVECQALDWTRTESSVVDNEKFDLILASDVLYNVELIPDLVRMMHENLKEDGGKVLLAVRWRKPEAERVFFRVMESEKGMEWSLLSSPLDCNLTWNEFGNPRHEPSNLYFWQHKIAVNGKLLPLAEIKEPETEAMSLDEHEAFEKCFLQVYLGQRRRKGGATVSSRGDRKRKHQTNKES